MDHDDGEDSAISDFLNVSGEKENFEFTLFR